MIYVMIQLAINCLVSYFLDLISRSWLAFEECDRLIRITGSYLSRSRADHFWNRALETVAADSTILSKAARCPHQLLLTVKITCDPLPNVLSAQLFHNGQVLILDKCTKFCMGLFCVNPSEFIEKQDRLAFSLGSNILFNVTKGQMKPAKQLVMGLGMKSITGSERSARFYTSLGIQFLVKNRRESYQKLERLAQKVWRNSR